MTMFYQIEVDETTGAQVMNEMLEKYRIMPTLMADKSMDKETVCRLVHNIDSKSKPIITMSKYAHLKIVRTAI